MFKKLLLVLLALMLITSMAYATIPPGPKGDKGDKGDQGIQGEPGVQGEKGATGDCEKDMPYGAGLDVIVWQSNKDNVALETQYKYDINNQEHSVFAVVKINLWDIVKK